MSTADVSVGAGNADRELFRLPIRGAAEATILIWIYVVYSGLRNFVTGSPAVAAHHADQILHFERFLGIGVGQPVRDATEDLTWLRSFANLVYATHDVMTVVVLGALYRKVPERYRRWRDTFVLMLVIGVIGFWLYPVMPPRILATSYHFVNTSHRLSIGNTPLPGTVVPNPNRFDVFGFSNPYAAMPSLHVAWALLVPIAAWPVLRSGWLKVAAVLYAILMVGAVTVTWNHWVLDSIGGGVTVVVAYALAGRVERLKAWIVIRADSRHTQNVSRRSEGSPVY